jgi:hypothetical protein
VLEPEVARRLAQQLAAAAELKARPNDPDSEEVFEQGFRFFRMVEAAFMNRKGGDWHDDFLTSHTAIVVSTRALDILDHVAPRNEWRLIPAMQLGLEVCSTLADTKKPLDSIQWEHLEELRELCNRMVPPLERDSLNRYVQCM